MLTEEEFRLFRTLIYDESGMFLKETKKDFLEDRLAKRMQATNMTTPYWYYRFVMAAQGPGTARAPGQPDHQRDRFFQEPAAVRAVPERDPARDPGREPAVGPQDVRIWSAGSSTGEEPYSIAMTVLDALPHAGEWDIRIFASDISMKSLEIAHRGVYPAAKVRESALPGVVLRYFDQHGRRTRVKDNVRKLVVFDYHNLKHENGPDALNAVFCRNVMIYFDEEEQKRLVHKFYRSLLPGGYLLLGHAESLHGWNMNFRFMYGDKGTAYKKL